LSISKFQFIGDSIFILSFPMTADI
jgi:hypothetical protein